MSKVNAPAGGRVSTALAALAALALGTASAAAKPKEGPRAMTLSQVLAAAAAQNPDLVIARTAIAASERKVASIKARRYPAISLEAQLLRWNEALVFDLGMPGAPATATVRDQYTSTISARAVQPLSGLLVIGNLSKAANAGLRAARADVDARRLDVVAGAATAFLAALQTRALRDIASESIAQLDAQLVQARALASVGSLDRVDVMRIDAARSAAEQELSAIRAAVRDADEGLLLILGLPLDTRFEPVDDFPAVLAPVAVDEGEATAAALDRPELRAADARAVQALGARDLAKSNLLPNINAILQVDHTEGQSTFAAKNSWFVGLTLSWNLWDWKSTWHEMKAAGAEAKGARLAARRARDRARLEVRSAVRGARAAYQKLGAAARGASAAEEAYRIQSVRFKEGALTTTDLLAAQVEVTRARGALALARFEYLAAAVTLRRAMGQAPQTTEASK